MLGISHSAIIWSGGGRDGRRQESTRQITNPMFMLSHSGWFFKLGCVDLIIKSETYSFGVSLCDQLKNPARIGTGGKWKASDGGLYRGNT